jgi:hypothetical protein
MNARPGDPTAPCRRSESRLFGEQRIGCYASAIAIGYVVGLAIRLIRHQWVLHPSDQRACTDFIWIWLSSKFASAGGLVHAYDYSRFASAGAALDPVPHCVLEHFDYPPTLLFFTYPLGFLPYPAGFAAWIAATFALYLAAVCAILPRPAAVIAAITPFPVFFNVLAGQGGFLSAALVGLALATLERRPLFAGCLLGLLTYKPQLGILVPVALAAGRYWRAFVAAAASGILLAAAAAIAFGADTWPAFAGALGERAASLSEAQSQAFVAALVSVFGTLRSIGVSAEVSWLAQLLVTAAAAVTVATLWARPIAYPLKAAALAVAAVVASPHTHGYDVVVLTIAAAFLVKDGLAAGFLRGERTLLLLAWAGLFLLTGPVPAIVSVLLLGVVVRRAVRLAQTAGGGLCAVPATAGSPP